MFLGGVIMLATGISLILNYGVFEITLLPPDLNNEEGKKTVGIILTVCGLLAIIVSVIVSVLYLCHKSKPAVNPDDLSRIPTSSRTTPDRQDRRDRRPGQSNKPGTSSNVTRHHQHTKHTPGSTEVKIPRSHRKGRHPRKRGGKLNRLEEIKEDAISRKTVDAALASDNQQESGSFGSQVTIDEMNRLPKVVLDDYSARPPSECSTSTSQFSDTSSYRFLENDKSRRELQFMSGNMRNSFSRQPETESKDTMSVDQYDETSLIESRQDDQGSLYSDGLVNPCHEYSIKRQLSQPDDPCAAGGTVDADYGEMPDVLDTDSSITSYKLAHKREMHGETSFGRVSPQIGEPETCVDVEPATEYHKT